jgi:uncharacterized membrane protein YraQ (UPF0718 family)
MKSKKHWIILLLILLWFPIYLLLDDMVDFLLFNLAGLERGLHLTESLWFFLYEVPKVMMLLVLIIFFVGIIRSFFTPEKTRKALEGKSLFSANIMASGLGILTPFCSCSAIPLFIGFVKSGIPIGVTFSFLIAAPMINEVALVLLIGLFGWKVSLIYVTTGLIIATFAGFIIEKLNLQRYVADWVYEAHSAELENNEIKVNLSKRIDQGIEAVREIVGKIWIYIIIGIAIGAGAHGYVPDALLADTLGARNWYSIPFAILIGIPLYSNAAGIIPIVSVLIEKGVSLGTALAFMMSVIGLSLPEIIILKKILKWPLILSFIGIVAGGILIVGFIFNYLLVL